MSGEQLSVPGEITGPDAPEPASAGSSQRPEYIPEKFWDADKGEVRTEDMARAYAEAEKRIGGRAGDDPSAAEEAAEEDPSAAKEAAKEDAEAGKEKEASDKETEEQRASVEEYSQRYAEKGELTDDDRAEIRERFNVSDADIDAFKAGQEAIAERATQRILEAAGGEEQVDRISVWANGALTDEQLGQFNVEFKSGDPQRAVDAMTGLRELYEKANGRAGSRPPLTGKGASSAAPGYDSWAQVTRDMARPEYKSDPAFREKVGRRLAASNTTLP